MKEILGLKSSRRILSVVMLAALVVSLAVALPVGSPQVEAVVPTPQVTYLVNGTDAASAKADLVAHSQNAIDNQYTCFAFKSNVPAAQA